MRRRVLIDSGSVGPSKPYPYSIDDWTLSETNLRAELTDWNKLTVTCPTTYTSAGAYVNMFNGTESISPAANPTYLTFPANSTVTLKLTNISNANSMPIEIHVTGGGTTSELTALNIARFTNSSDKTATATFGSDTTCGGIWVNVVRTGRISGNVFACDLELYVNGERWI